MRQSNEPIIYAYDGDLPLTKENWKCATCINYKGLDKPCFTGHIKPGQVKTIYPDKRFEHTDNCVPYICIANDEKYVYTMAENKETVESEQIDEATRKFNQLANSNANLHDEIVKAIDEERNYSINTDIPNILEVKCEGNGKTYTATVVMDPSWNNTMKELAIEKSKATLNETIINEANEIRLRQEKQLTDIRNNINDIINDGGGSIVDDEPKDGIPLFNDEPDYGASLFDDEKEKMLDGETKISWLNQVTSWNRVLNAARRTIGKNPLDKEPSDSWKAKILLAEHSPIRLLEYDWGWEKIRQWVTAHFVRHHEGVEKFVHSQRGDRRELPCDRDHIYQGAKNDMDMSANAQGLINMSRKRCCNCASKETREAWNMVLNELEKSDPVLRSKCVRECVYRGFCPEWMSKCGYWKTDEYKRERAEYKNTKFDDDVKYKLVTLDNFTANVSNTGHIYNLNNIEYLYTSKFENGHKVVYVNNIPVCSYVIMAFTEHGLVKESDVLHIDGNEWNNNIDNLKIIE